MPPPQTNPQAVELSLSQSRIKPYLVVTGYTGIDNALTYYAWHAELSAAYFEVVQYFEVVMRNALSEGLSNLYGPDWPWSPSFINRLDNKNQQLLSEAKHQFQPGNADRVIAKLMFGFWLGMCTKKHQADFWDKQLLNCFPNIPMNSTTTGQARINLYKDVEAIKNFRNRVAHHEPIFKTNHAQQLVRILRLIGYRCADTRLWVENTQRVDDLNNRKPVF